MDILGRLRNKTMCLSGHATVHDVLRAYVLLPASDVDRQCSRLTPYLLKQVFEMIRSLSGAFYCAANALLRPTHLPFLSRALLCLRNRGRTRRGAPAVDCCSRSLYDWMTKVTAQARSQKKPLSGVPPGIMVPPEDRDAGLRPLGPQASRGTDARPASISSRMA